MAAITRKTGSSLHGSLAAEPVLGGVLPLAVEPLLAPPPPATSASWVNASGGDWGTAANWSPSGVPTSSVAATIGLAGSYTVTISAPESAQSLSVTDAGATVIDTSTLSIGTTLSLAAGVFQLGNGGEVSGGTISVAGGADFQQASVRGEAGGTLSAVTLAGTLDVSADWSTLTILNGITFKGPGGTGTAIVNFAAGGDGQNSALNIAGTTTLNNAVIDIGHDTGTNSGINYLYNLDPMGNGAVLTLGPTLVINHTSGQVAFYSSDSTGDGIVNQGTINAGAAGGLFTIDATNFTNKGTMTVSNGDVLRLVGQISTVLIDSIKNTSGLVSLDGSVAGGTITASGGGIGSISFSNDNGGIDQGLNSGGTLSGVTYQGTLSLSADWSELTIKNGITFEGSNGTGAATVNFAAGGDGQNSALNIDGTTTLNNAVIDIGHNTATNSGENYIQNLDPTSTGAILTLGPNLSINQTDGQVGIYSNDGAGDGIVNQGTINAGAGGGLFTIDATNFTNSGTITVSGGDVLRLVGPITTALIDSIKNPSGLISLDGTVSGGTITAPNGGIGSISFSNGYGGIDQGLNSGGTLSGVTYQGTLNLSADYSELTIRNGITFEGGNGTGAATVNFAAGGDGQNSALNIDGTTTLNNAVIDIGHNTATNSGENYIQNLDPTSTGAILTLGPNLSINQTDGQVGIYSSDGAGDGIVNQGTINAGAGGGLFTIDATNFTNSGTITVSGGDVLRLVGPITTALIDSIKNPSGLISLDGTVSGGTITAPNGGIGSISFSNGYGGIDQGLNSGGTLSGVTYQGTLNLSADYSELTIRNGITFEGGNGTGAATVNFAAGGDGQNSALNIDGTTTLNNAVIDIGHNTATNSGENYIQNLDPTSTGAILTLGPNLSINQTDGQVGIYSSDGSGDGIVNQGTINAAGGGLFTIDATNFTNNGTINVSGGDVLRLVGPITTALIDSIKNPSGLISLDGTVLGGTITAPNGGIGSISFSNGNGGINGNLTSGGTLSGVTYLGTLNLSADNSALTITNGITFAGGSGTGSATVDFAGSYNASPNLLNIAGTTTLNNATIDIGNNGGGSDTIVNDDLTAGGAVLTLGSSLVINQTGERAFLTSTNLTGDAIVNDGSIYAGLSGGGFVLGATSFTNNGTITAASGETFQLESTSFSNLASDTLTAGTYVIAGGSTLQLANGFVINTDDADIVLNGSGSVIQSLNSAASTQTTLDSTLSKIATTGTLTLQNGRDFTATANNGGFVDDGRLTLSAGTLTATTLTTAASGSVFGNGTITATISNAGLIEANSGYLLLQGAVTGAGTLQIDAGSTLEIGGAAPATETTNFNGTTAKLKIDTPAQYASKIQNFVGSDVIDLANTTLTSVSTSGTSLLAVSASGTTTLTLAAPLTNLHLALGNDGTGGTDITAYNLAQPAAHSPEPVKLGNVHVGAADSAFVTLTNAAPANGFSEKLDAALAGATGSATAGGTVSKLAAGASNSTTLAIGLLTTTAGTLSGTATLTLASDGSGVDSFGTTTLASQTVNVTGAVYAYAKGTLANAGTLTLANTHAGHATSGFVTLTNGAAAGGYSESLDAAFAGASTGITTSGTLQGLAAGAQNTNALQLGFSPANVGAYTGTATLALTSDGNGLDGLGTTALAAQTITVKGAAYGYAVGQIASGGIVVMANTHVGHTVAANVAVTNGAAANGYSEALDASITANTSGLSAAGTIALLAAGASNMTGLSVSANEAMAGAYTGTAIVGLVSSGTGIDGLGTTALTSQTVTITGNAYAYAVGQLASQTINLGVVHVGAAASQNLTLTNAAAAGVYAEALDASWGSAGAGVSVSGSVSLLAAGAHASTLSIGLATSNSGSFSGSAALALLSDGSGIDGLGTTALAGQTITVTGIVDNYALAAFQDGSGPAISGSGTSYAINLGSVVQGSTGPTFALGAENAASGLADLLQGTLSITGTTGFIDSGFGSFSGLGAGQSESVGGVTLTTGTAGVFSETVILSSAGTNASGYDGQLATETLTITGTVVSAGSSNTYTLANGPNTILGAAGGDVFVATSASINSLDSLTGGSGSNTLQMLGGGLFDLAAPKTFANIQTLIATEAQAPKTGGADPRQTVVMPNQAETLDVQSGTPAKGNAHPETITIYDGTDNDTFNLGSNADTLYLGAGSDTVTLGGAANSVFAGGGTAMVDATKTTATASIVGTTTGSTVLNISTGGTIALNAADTYLTVKLDAATHLTLGVLGYITANGGNGGDTIVAGGANQTLIGGSADVLNGSVAGSDIFLGASAALNGDTLGNWTTGDVIDLTDMNAASLKPLEYTGSSTKGTLTVKDGTHTSAIVIKGTGLSAANFTVIGSDGSGGTLIGWHAG